MARYQPVLRRRVSGTAGVVHPLAMVTGWQLIGSSDSRWLYSLRRVGIDTNYNVVELDGEDFATLPNLPESAGDPAINIRELTNIAQRTGVQGDSVNQADDDDNSYPEGFSLSPIGGGTEGVPDNQAIVEYWRGINTDGSPVWIFDEVNAHNGVC
jgi:hypothetical protein